MRKIYFLLIFMLTTAMLMAQTFQVRLNETDTLVNQDDTIHVHGTSDITEIKKHFQIDNISDNDINIKATLEIISAPDGMDPLFCLDVCYMPGTTESNAVTIPANSTYSNTLDIDIRPYENTGDALVKTTVSTVSISSEELSFFVHFSISDPNGISEEMARELMLYPNPIRNKLNIMCRENRQNLQLEIYDAVGKRIRQLKIQKDVNYQVDFGNLPNGLYMIKLRDKNTVLQTRKLIKR